MTFTAAAPVRITDLHIQQARRTVLPASLDVQPNRLFERTNERFMLPLLYFLFPRGQTVQRVGHFDRASRVHTESLESR